MAAGGRVGFTRGSAGALRELLVIQERIPSLRLQLALALRCKAPPPLTAMLLAAGSFRILPAHGRL